MERLDTSLLLQLCSTEREDALIIHFFFIVPHYITDVGEESLGNCSVEQCSSECEMGNSKIL